jgi:stress response protein SCP2
MTRLSPGANHPLPADRLEVRISSPRDVDILGLLVDERQQTHDDHDVVFRNAPETEGVRWVAGTPAHLVVEPHRVPGRVAAILVVLALPEQDGTATFADLPTAELLLNPGASTAPVHVPLSGLGPERAVIGAEVYRRGGAWRVRAVVQGYAEGLARLLTAHGVAVDEPAPTTAAPSAATSTTAAPSTAAPTSAASHSSPSVGARAAHTPSPHEVDYADRAWLIWEDASRAVSAHRSAVQHALTVRDHEVAGRAQRTSSEEILRAAGRRLEEDLAQLSAEVAGTADHAPAAMADWSSPHWLTWQCGERTEPGVLAGHLTHEQALLRIPLILRRPWEQALWLCRGPLPGDSVAFCWSLVTRYLAALPAGSVAVEVIDPSGLGGLDWIGALPQPVVNGVLAGGVAGGAAQARSRLGQLLDIVDLRAIGAGEEAAARSGGRPRRLVVVVDPAGAGPDDELVDRLLRLTDDGPRLGVTTICVETDTDVTRSLRMLRIQQSGTVLPSGSEETLGDPWVRSEWSFTPALLPDAAAALRGSAGSVPALLRQTLCAHQEAGA